MECMIAIKDDGLAVALVTGGTSGIERATAELLAWMGWRGIVVGSSGGCIGLPFQSHYSGSSHFGVQGPCGFVLTYGHLQAQERP